MKIKAIMLGLAFSGGLLLANSSQGLNNSDTIQQYIDTLNFNPLDPNLIKEIVKALSRLDNNINRLWGFHYLELGVNKVEWFEW